MLQTMLNTRHYLHNAIYMVGTCGDTKPQLHNAITWSTLEMLAHPNLQSPALPGKEPNHQNP